MSTLHLGPDSERPPQVDGLARLFSMKFCPFAHRIRLILALKKVPHDIVNINLKNKPKWYLQIHPEGKVPAFIDVDGKIVIDSVSIASYLDGKYPNPPLYPEATKSRDLELLDQYSKISGLFARCVHSNDKRPLNEVFSEMSDLLTEFEDELEFRGTNFYGGDTPGMLDIVMWPWVERVKALPIIYKEPVNFHKEKFPNMMKWIANMKAEQFVRDNVCSYEKFAQLIQATKAGNVDYDQI